MIYTTFPALEEQKKQHSRLCLGKKLFLQRRQLVPMSSLGPFTLFVIFIPHVATELSLGNIHVFLALVTVFGLRWPWLWSFALLTKVTPGVGLVWFAVRREWRALAIALGVTAAIALPTVLLFPDLWAGWFRVITDAGPDAGSNLLARVVLGAAVVAVGAWRNWPWLVPVGSMLALPVLWSLHGFSMLVAVLWYVRKLPLFTDEPATERGRRSAATDSAIAANTRA